MELGDQCPDGLSLLDQSTARMRVGHIGEVTGVGECWRLTYDHCEHVQEFAREGLEDPDRLVHVIERNFSECLTCRLEKGRAGEVRPPADGR